MSLIIREGTAGEVENFPMYNEENEGEIVVAELDGVVVAFMQHQGAYIHILEAAKVGTGAGTTLVEWLKEQCDELYAQYVLPEAEGFWVKQGFEFESRTGVAKNFVWYAE